MGADSGGTSSKTETLDCGFALRVLPEAMDPRMSRILVASVCEVRASALPKTHAPGYSPHASSPPYTPRASPLDLAATAAAHFELGAQAYAAKQWDAARAEFQVCFELSKRTDLLHNLSLVAEKQGRVADAVQLERDFRERTQLTEPERKEATKRIARLEGQAPALVP